jgi:hypothetical protein
MHQMGHVFRVEHYVASCLGYIHFLGVGAVDDTTPELLLL